MTYSVDLRKKVVGLVREGGSQAEAARRQVRMQVLRDTAAILGNTPRICERCYVDPRVFEGWEDGRLQRVAANARGPRQWEQAATRLLKRTRRGS